MNMKAKARAGVANAGKWWAHVAMLLAGIPVCAAASGYDYCITNTDFDVPVLATLQDSLLDVSDDVFLGSRDGAQALPKTLFVDLETSYEAPGELLATGPLKQYHAWVDVFEMRWVSTPSETVILETTVSPFGTQANPFYRVSFAGFCFKEFRPPTSLVIGFFNGVANTDEAAQKSVDRLEVEFGPRYKDTPLKYDWFYNQTACGEGILGKPSCLEDVAEVFDQRTRELGGVFASRWETFWDILAGRYQQETSFTGQVLGRLGNGGNALLQWLDASLNAILNQLARDTLKLITLFKDSPTYENRANHMERLWRYADEGNSMVLVAHSQGNLFVNSAYDALKAFKPGAQAQVVHVAPASPTLRGNYVLADIDLVINALRVTGLNSVPDVNINLPLSKADPTGHGFEPTYLDKARAAYARTRGLIVQSLDALAN